MLLLVFNCNLVATLPLEKNMHVLFRLCPRLRILPEKTPPGGEERSARPGEAVLSQDKGNSNRAAVGGRSSNFYPRKSYRLNHDFDARIRPFSADSGGGPSEEIRLGG